MTFHPTGQTIGNLTPPLSIANGGTGQTAVPAAFTALAASGGTVGGAVAMGSNKITGLGNGTATGDAAAFGQVNLDNFTHPAQAVAATMPRRQATAISNTLTSGTLYLALITIPGGTTVTNCTMFTATTAKTGGTHGWYVLLDTTFKVVAVTADQTDAATVWGATNTGYPLAFGATFTPTVTANYYVGVMVAQSAGGTPTFSVSTALSAGLAAATGIAGGVVQCGTSSTGQTTPPALNATLTTITGAAAFNLYAYLT